MNKRWNIQEINLLKAMVAKKTPLKIIAKHFNVTQNSISKTLQRYCKGYASARIQKIQQLQIIEPAKNYNYLINIVQQLRKDCPDIFINYENNHYKNRRSVLLEINRTLLNLKIDPITYEEFLRLQILYNKI